MNITTRVVAAAAASMLAFGFGGAAAQAAAPTHQGSADGVLYAAEITDGTVYIGDIKNPTSTIATFWHETDSYVDQVAVTKDHVAWAAGDENSTIANKVLIASKAKSAANITTVDLPGTAIVSALAADATGDLVYASVGDKIYAINAKTGTYVTSLTDASVSDISWGLWVDGYNNRIYYCDAMDNTGDVYGGNLNASGIASSVAVIHAAVNGACDGIGNDPVTGRVYTASYGASSFTVDPMIFAWMNGDGTGSPTEIAVPNADTYAMPSSMFVSHDTGKIFWAEEGYIREMNLDGSGLRTLYTGAHPVSGGFENIAITFGSTLADLPATSPASDALAPTGGSNAIAVAALLGAFVALAAGIVIRRRANQY